MQEKTKAQVKDFLILNVGTLLTAVGTYFFKFPNNFSTGGVTGLGSIDPLLSIPEQRNHCIRYQHRTFDFGPDSSWKRIWLQNFLCYNRIFGNAQGNGIFVANDTAADRPAIYGVASGRVFAGMGLSNAV